MVLVKIGNCSSISTGQKHFHRSEAFPPDRSISTGQKHFHRIEAFPPDRSISTGQKHFHRSEAFPLYGTLSICLLLRIEGTW
ncbi:hypothetical protein POVWA1_001890 [Plasmodium ovale wallikeri]|uniref:Uncharacterized protein n=1 Tax=Plasmodium ovale wallikeri TaxID=864142 RepID=A0A1A8YG62_PLAOA|nr:hypothetical protein POVWA1_001890 [Plasmodium ovale wallikeri]